MRKIAPLAGALSAALLLLAGCATPPAPIVQTHDYACEGGRGFRLKIAGEATDIVLDGMRFGLQPEASSGGELIYSCNMLRVMRQGDAAQVEMEGRPYLANCRRVP